MVDRQFNSQAERNAITAAMERLLADPRLSAEDLTAVLLAKESGLKRNMLTHKHKDLRDQFYAEVKKREGISDRELRLREEIAMLKERVADLREERTNYRTASEVFARAINVLTVDNDNLRKELNKTRNAKVTRLPPRS
jgi:septal ring factor EnvC (AmiA/AmiB activator)